MAGDLLLTNIDELELGTLLNSGGVLGDTIYHADRFAGGNWDIWGARLTAGLEGSRDNNRVGLPPHFYISFSRKNLKPQDGTNLLFAKIIGSAVRPLTIVSAQPGLEGWSIKNSNSVSLNMFTAALDRGGITLEIYSFDGEDLINRGDGVRNPSLSYLKLANE